jgi:hypothetical protein
MHHVGIPLLKNTIVATIEKHVNIHTHTNCMYTIYVKIRMNLPMYVNI